MRYRCSMCRSTTMVKLLWDRRSVCPACYFHERNLQDRLTFGAAVDICRDKQICVYCGESATDKEHVIPRASGLPTWVVPACSECNTIACASVHDGLLAKKRHIQSRLRKRHARSLRVPYWDEDELAELGDSLRGAVLAHQRCKSVVECRVSWTLPGEGLERGEEAA